MSGEVVLQAVDLKRYYEVDRGTFKKPATLKALDGASFTLKKGKTLAIVGESGCGKSTMARLVTMIETPTSGQLIIGDEDVSHASRSTRSRLHKKVQIVFQDPYGSLNPRQKIGHSLEEPLLVNTSMKKAERREAALKMIRLVGLRPEHYDRYPHMFSGGQRQRIAVARALMLNPEIIVLDEPVSALDVSIQAQILNLIADLQQRFDLAYMFISHDLSVVKHIADEVMVMYLGKPVETGSRENIFARPHHPYTRALLSATPVADPFRNKERIVLRGELPSPIAPPSGCTFHPRCPSMTEKCTQASPELREIEGCMVACYHPKTY
ncbi:dipeptide ABC transporter ATP-binding protein [Desulforhopalus sp. IMCC35007]|uniref:dipeptide ABC transporter ATP-binding protein n=1 Tax=Desulforhopalus sp. IMCC35007 TaxID=2569543 RepID=UPI0010AEB05D|nr:dipeptide ABC transporter ATP-binding protein [Desulforhopalus sp. IMCC35007]TKB11597.1 dipeptide ABC transporter ATP-binding protein [Desulforhopalus sp. IMCC35007]